MSEKHKGWIREVISQIRRSQIWQYSTFITFYFLVTIFPIFVAIINGLRANGMSLEPLYGAVNQFLPQMLSERLIIDLEIIYSRSNVGVYLIALVSSIWTISLLTTSIAVSLNRAYGVRYRRNIVVLRIFAFFMTFILGGFLAGVISITQIFNFSSIMTWSVFVVALFLTFCFLYYTLPNAKQPFRYVLPGAVLGTVAVMAAIGVYFGLLHFLPGESIFYTLLGSFVIILEVIHKVWVSMLSGAVLNSYLTRRKLGELPEKNEDSKFIRALVKIKFLKEIQS